MRLGGAPSGNRIRNQCLRATDAIRIRLPYEKSLKQVAVNQKTHVKSKSRS